LPSPSFNFEQLMCRPSCKKFRTVYSFTYRGVRFSILLFCHRTGAFHQTVWICVFWLKITLTNRVALYISSRVTPLSSIIGFWRMLEIPWGLDFSNIHVQLPLKWTESFFNEAYDLQMWVLIFVFQFLEYTVALIIIFKIPYVAIVTPLMVDFGHQSFYHVFTVF
jgi:hypothetical protein